MNKHLVKKLVASEGDSVKQRGSCPAIEEHGNEGGGSETPQERGARPAGRSGGAFSEQRREGSQHLPDGPPRPEQAGLRGAPRPVPCGRARRACRSGLGACAQRGAEPLIAMESAEAEASESRPEEDGALPAGDLPLPEQPAATVRCGGWRGGPSHRFWSAGPGAAYPRGRAPGFRELRRPDAAPLRRGGARDSAEGRPALREGLQPGAALLCRSGAVRSGNAGPVLLGWCSRCLPAAIAPDADNCN